MREPIDHERCSELLAPFVHGELDAELASQVEAHLASCSDCSQERAGLEALVTDEVPPLTELERARLRRIVLSEAVPLPDEGAQVTQAAAPTSGGRRWFKVLGAAAALAAIGGFAYLGLGQGMGGQDTETSGDSFAGAESGGGGEGETESLNDGGSLKQRSAADQPAGSAEGATSLEAAAPPSPTFEADLGKVDAKRLNKLGRSGLPLVIFSRSYTTDNVAENQAAFIEEVAAQAPTARGDDIRACAGAVSEQFPNSLLAYAAFAEFTDRGDILVLAFAWTDKESGPMSQSMVWAWSIGDCDGIPVHYSKNVIRPRR